MGTKSFALQQRCQKHAGNNYPAERQIYLLPTGEVRSAILCGEDAVWEK